MDFNIKLETILKQSEKFCDTDGELLKQKVKSLALSFDEDLIEILLNDKDTKKHFFKNISGATIFNYRKFIDFIDDKNFLLDSYTKFSNKVGLSISDKHIKQIDNVVLTFPFKDCILEGGQRKDDESRKEIFFNETLAKDEISRLLDKKVIANATKYYYENGIVQETQDFAFTRDKEINKARGLTEDTITDNLLVKGNNLLALHSLKSNFAGKVKLIYIDPPYNTGKDSFGYNDTFSHSTWLTFMKNRLETAYELLKDDGVIWINLDDNESHYCKVLCDEIFNRENFISNIIWQKKYSPSNDAKWFSDNHDHILVFAKNKQAFRPNLLERTKEMNSRYKNPDNDPRGNWKPGGFSVKTYSKNYDYPITTPSGKTVNPPSGSCWQTSYENFLKLVQDNRIYFGKNNDSKPQIKQFLSEVQQGMVAKTIWLYDEVGHNQVSRSEITKLFGEFKFSTPKPEKLLKRIIELSTNPNDIVLDYHLGSGTTGAVAHKMNRQYIGIEQMDYIEDITIERMKKVIAGEQGGVSKDVNWQKGGEFIYFELDKYNQEFIDDLLVSSEENILNIYKKIIEKGFVNYDVELKKIEEYFDVFEKLSLEDKKEFLISILNKNTLYKNLSEIEDVDYAISERLKKINKDFYYD